MLDERKMAILRAVVETYIETAEPVGSGAVGKAADLGVSSATIRNELVQLDQQGYLTQPHTSAGRIPTDKGYRVFVDTLEEPGLESEQFQQVKSFFDQTHGEIEEMLDRTSRLLSEMTGVASVVVAPDRDSATVRSVQLVALAPRVVLAVVVLSDGTVEKGTIEAVDDLDEVQIAVAQGHLSAAMVGRAVSKSAAPSPSGNSAADRLVDSARAVLTTPVESGDVYVGGRAIVAGAFPEIETVREVLGLLEKQLVVVTLLRDVLDRGLSVAIGNETGVDPLADCSLVVAPYEVAGDQVGTIGLLGPTRMNYPNAMAAVAVVSQSLGKRLSDG
ncbi:MAG: heat-inducible transcriptional repressor HrcA [Acidimicrobiales bacterium]